MVDAVSFQTRARTVDHLGREQIADCPTAVSELWKNAYDAYATEVALHIFDGDIPVAAVVDNGHGMNLKEFTDRWLVIGTESKASGVDVSKEDRSGLPYRERQGQKGIGRLSSAYLGPLLLIVSKRADQPFVASLIDWRLFENPFLLLHDIIIPVVEFKQKNDLYDSLPGMFERLMSNIWGDCDDESRNKRLQKAWNDFDVLERKDGKDLTREKIKKTIIDTAFTERHFQCWPVWERQSEKGTALFISDIIFDLTAQLPNESLIESEKQARDKLFKTLSTFVDPFSNTHDSNDLIFKYSVSVWNGHYQRLVISKDREFGVADLEGLEHVLDGQVDSNGIFQGKIKAFGTWQKGEIVILPQADMPKRSDTKVGPFNIRIGAFEAEEKNTTLGKEIYSKINQQAEKYSGLMIYRNSLRVMPYGSENNDFFEIEFRRSKHAGREFWSARKMFGRIALTRLGNANLKDKAGREGIIDNRAAKAFKEIVENILTVSARRYFGSNSDIRQKLLPGIQANKREEKTLEDRNKLRVIRRKKFRTNLRAYLPILLEKADKLDLLSREFDDKSSNDNENVLLNIREQMMTLVEDLPEYTLGQPPADLGPLEDEYREYRILKKRIQERYADLKEKIDTSLEKIKPKAPREIAYSELSRHGAFLHNRIKQWVKKATAILDSEKTRLSELAESRNKLYHSRMMPILDDVEHERITLNRALDELSKEKEREDFDNSESFEPYIFALESLKESIDLSGIAAFGEDRISELREEVDRLNALAQLGITVEILGHELETLDTSIARGLNGMPNEIKKTQTFQTVIHAHEDLMNRLRFLSPLKLSGERTKKWITGHDIYDYILKFFGDVLSKNNVKLESSSSFQSFRVYEQPARLFPVFLNLVNNARYWVCRSDKSGRNILLDTLGEKVVVADDGPGVEEDDYKHLFTLFFTRKIRGGRGVGLYLCRSNLASGGHTIKYAGEESEKRLTGANFIISFKGAEYV